MTVFLSCLVSLLFTLFHLNLQPFPQIVRQPFAAMAEPHVVIVSDLSCLSFLRVLANYDPANGPDPTSNDLDHLFRITSWERLRWMTMDEIKCEIQMMLWIYHELSVCRKDFVLLLSTLRTTRNETFAIFSSKLTALILWKLFCGVGTSLLEPWKNLCEPELIFVGKQCPTYFMQLETFCPTVAPSLKEKDTRPHGCVDLLKRSKTCTIYKWIFGSPILQQGVPGASMSLAPTETPIVCLSTLFPSTSTWIFARFSFLFC